MRKTNLQPLVDATLAWCNERRAERGRTPLDRLPKGRRGHARECPCGTASGLRVYSNVYTDESGVRHDTPSPVKAFINAFDAGRLPEYDIHAGPA